MSIQEGVRQYLREHERTKQWFNRGIYLFTLGGLAVGLGGCSLDSIRDTRDAVVDSASDRLLTPDPPTETPTATPTPENTATPVPTPTSTPSGFVDSAGSEVEQILVPGGIGVVVGRSQAHVQQLYDACVAMVRRTGRDQLTDCGPADGIKLSEGMVPLHVVAQMPSLVWDVFKAHDALRVPERLTFDQADASCQARGDGSRLPITDERTYAGSRGGLNGEPTLFPWGNGFDVKSIHYAPFFAEEQGEAVSFEKVEAYPDGMTTDGLHDMIGELEWVVYDDGSGNPVPALMGGGMDHWLTPVGGTADPRQVEFPADTTVVATYRCVKPVEGQEGEVSENGAELFVLVVWALSAARRQTLGRKDVVEQGELVWPAISV